jgi:hypothetical protein
VRNVFAASRYPLRLSYAVDLGRALNSVEAKALFLGALRWQEDSNLYLASDLFLRMTGPDVGKAVFEIADLAGWHGFWGLENTGSTEGVIRFQGGNLLARAKSHPEQLTPEDFRLRPDSAGYRAGPDGKDLGADVDLVGPGEAYERWKKTPEYQEWDRQTRELIEASIGDQRAEAVEPAESALPPDNEFTVLPNGWRFGRPTRLGPNVNSPRDDIAPCVSHDQYSLFFASNRLAGQGRNDLWRCTRAGPDDPWGQAENLGPIVNGTQNDTDPCLSSDGLTLLFASDRPGGEGEFDLWMSTRDSPSDPWGEPVNLGPDINTPSLDCKPSLASDGLTLLFSKWPGGEGGIDLYMSTREGPSDPWRRAENLGPIVNSPQVDTDACLSADGLTLLFVSNRPGGVGEWDLWMSTRPSRTAPWGEPWNLGTILNTSALETHPHLSPDGHWLFFSSTRLGSRNLYVAPVLPPEKPEEALAGPGRLPGPAGGEGDQPPARPADKTTEATKEKSGEEGTETRDQGPKAVEPAEPAPDP